MYKSIQLIGSEISVLGHTSRPSGYVVKKYKDPSDENSAFLQDEIFENDFKQGGLGYEADAFARTLKGKYIAADRWMLLMLQMACWSARGCLMMSRC
jgi:hypothetical protein